MPSREQDGIDRSGNRINATVQRTRLKLGDDTLPTQTWQVEGFPTEIRSNVQRHSEFGFSSMPLPGAVASTHWDRGHRGS